MAEGDYKRLLKWSEESGDTITVNRPNPDGFNRWSIAVRIDDPVVFDAGGDGATIDEAAAEVINQLGQVGVEVQ